MRFFEGGTSWGFSRFTHVLPISVVRAPGRELDPGPSLPQLVWYDLSHRCFYSCGSVSNNVWTTVYLNGWSDDEVFEGLVRSILSANTKWAKVERVLPELCTLLHDLSLSWYAALSPIDVERTLVPWFEQRKAGSISLNQNLQRLIESAGQLSDISQRHGSLENYLVHLSQRHNGDPKVVAAALGEVESPAKLPGLGVALAAEFLKNVGYDVSKPDLHINRAVGSFGLVQFARWPDQRGFKAPQAKESELRTVMQVMETWALKLGFRVTFLDNAVWLLCAALKSGLHLSNSDLAALKPQVAPNKLSGESSEIVP